MWVSPHSRIHSTVIPDEVNDVNVTKITEHLTILPNVEFVPSPPTNNELSGSGNNLNLPIHHNVVETTHPVHQIRRHLPTNPKLITNLLDSGHRTLSGVLDNELGGFVVGHHFDPLSLGGDTRIAGYGIQDQPQTM
jgi:hypothetical protein